MFDLSKLEKHTSKQDGLVTREQALGEGLSASSVARAVQSELLMPVFRGVYRVRDTPVTPKLLRRAALLWAGEGAVLSHVTAGLMWKLEGLPKDADQTIWISIPYKRAVIPPAGIRVVRTRHLANGRDHGLVDNLKCTSLKRTLLDLASVLAPEYLDVALCSAERTSVGIRRELIDLGKRVGRRGRHGQAALMELARREEVEGTKSPLEVRVRHALREAGIVPPMPQLQVVDSQTGDQIGIFDFAWPELFVVVEVDSWEFHKDRTQFDRDHLKFEQLAANGWTVVPVTSTRLDNEREEFLNNVRRSLKLGGRALVKP